MTEHEPAIKIEKHKDYGKVPDYLEKFKDEMKISESKKLEEKEKAKLPPGTRMMSEEERVQTLEDL